MVDAETPSIQHILESAVGHHGAGRLPEAEGGYRQVLDTAPNHPVVLHLLGVIAHQVGQNDVAVELISKAVSVHPNYAHAHNNLDAALKELGRLDDAMASYRRAIGVNPEHIITSAIPWPARVRRKKLSVVFKRQLRLSRTTPRPTTTSAMCLRN